MRKTKFTANLSLADTNKRDSNIYRDSFHTNSGAELMKRNALLLQAALLGLVGCTGQTTPVATPTVENEATVVAEGPTGDSGIATLVSLKVPNMH